MSDMDKYYKLDDLIGGRIGSQEKISPRRRAYILKKTGEAMQRERDRVAAEKKSQEAAKQRSNSVKK